MRKCAFIQNLCTTGRWTSSNQLEELSIIYWGQCVNRSILLSNPERIIFKEEAILPSTIPHDDTSEPTQTPPKADGLNSDDKNNTETNPTKSSTANKKRSWWGNKK